MGPASSREQIGEQLGEDDGLQINPKLTITANNIVSFVPSLSFTWNLRAWLSVPLLSFLCRDTSFIHNSFREFAARKYISGLRREPVQGSNDCYKFDRSRSRYIRPRKTKEPNNVDTAFYFPL